MSFVAYLVSSDSQVDPERIRAAREIERLRPDKSDAVERVLKQVCGEVVQGQYFESIVDKVGLWAVRRGGEWSGQPEPVPVADRLEKVDAAGVARGAVAGAEGVAQVSRTLRR